jgi:hypothetical protein
MKPIITRSLTPLLAGLLTLSLLACASQEEKEKKEAGPKALGYSIMNKDGQPLYCRRMAVTGSNVMTKTTCLTAQQWQQMHDNDQQTLEEMRRGFDIPK